MEVEFNQGLTSGGEDLTAARAQLKERMAEVGRRQARPGAHRSGHATNVGRANHHEGPRQAVDRNALNSERPYASNEEVDAPSGMESQASFQENLL